MILAVAGFVIGAASLAGGDDESDLRAELDRLQREAARAMQRGWVAKGAPPSDERGNELALLPVEDLVTPVFDVIPPSHRIGVFENDEFPLFAGIADEGQLAFGTAEELVELLRTVIDPAAWEAGVIYPHGKQILVLNRPATLGRVRQFLDRTLRPRAHRGVSVDFEVVAVPGKLSRRLQAARGGRLGDTERKALDEALNSGAARRVIGLRGNGLLDARFLTWHGRQIAIAGDFEVEVAQTASTADPVVQVVQAGGSLSVRATTGESAKRISLDLRLMHQELAGLRRHETRRSGNIDMPDLLTQDARVTMNVAPGVWTIVAAGTPRPGEHRLFLVRARLTERGGVQ